MPHANGNILRNTEKLFPSAPLRLPATPHVDVEVDALQTYYLDLLAYPPKSLQLVKSISQVLPPLVPF